jgi:hypothetical protein
MQIDLINVHDGTGGFKLGTPKLASQPLQNREGKWSKYI